MRCGQCALCLTYHRSSEVRERQSYRPTVRRTLRVHAEQALFAFCFRRALCLAYHRSFELRERRAWIPKGQQRLLCMGAERSSDCWAVRLALPYLGASVVLSATAHTDRISSLNSSGVSGSPGSLARSNVLSHLRALLLVTFLVPARKVTRRRAAPGGLSRSEKTVPARSHPVRKRSRCALTQ